MNYAYNLSILIVTYKSADCIQKCLDAIFASKTQQSFEVIIIDNSGNQDGTVDLVNQKYLTKHPNLKIIKNDNVGFGKANNQALQIAQGREILLLNPDTQIQDDTLEVMMDFLEKHSDVGIATCKLVRPDGTLDKACRRSLPDPLNSLSRFLGLSLLFPNSKKLAKYNLSFLDENQETEIEACTGAFMLIRRELLEKLPYLFDPEYFMYGEDLDLCLRAKQAGFKIWYYPKTQILNLKGMSSRKESTLANKAFHDAMKIYYRKNLAHKYPILLNWLVYLGINLRHRIKSMLLKIQKEKVISK